MTTINIKEIPTSTYKLEDETFYCQHDGDTNTEKVETTFFIGETDMSYESEIVLCADCDEQIEDN